MFSFIGLFALLAPLAEEEWIDEAYVTFSTANYFPLVEVLIQSVEAFSSHPIVVIGVNADVPFSSQRYPHMIKRRMDIGCLKSGRVAH